MDVLRVLFVVCLIISAGCNSAPDEIRTYNMGVRVQTGPLIYVAADPRWSLMLGAAPSQRFPLNRFLIVHMNITNAGATDSAVPTLSLVDDSGQTFNELADGASVPDWLGIARKLRPIATEKGTIAFDVAPGHYKLRVADETEQIVAYIDLPATLLDEEKSQ